LKRLNDVLTYPLVFHEPTKQRRSLSLVIPSTRGTERLLDVDEDSLSDSLSDSADSDSEDEAGGVRRLDSVSNSNSDSNSEDEVAAGGVRRLVSDEDSVSDSISNSDSDSGDEDGDARRLFLFNSISISTSDSEDGNDIFLGNFQGLSFGGGFRREPDGSNPFNNIGLQAGTPAITANNPPFAGFTGGVSGTFNGGTTSSSSTNPFGFTSGSVFP
jgi:hypothetical protein